MPGNYPRVFAPTGSDRLRAVRLLCSPPPAFVVLMLAADLPSSMAEVPPSGSTSGKQTLGDMVGTGRQHAVLL